MKFDNKNAQMVAKIDKCEFSFPISILTKVCWNYKKCLIGNKERSELQKTLLLYSISYIRCQILCILKFIHFQKSKSMNCELQRTLLYSHKYLYLFMFRDRVCALVICKLNSVYFHFNLNLTPCVTFTMDTHVVFFQNL